MVPWAVACQAPLSMGFPRQEWKGLLFLSPGDLPDPRIEPVSPAFASECFTTGPVGKPLKKKIWWLYICVCVCVCVCVYINISKCNELIMQYTYLCSNPSLFLCHELSKTINIFRTLYLLCLLPGVPLHLIWPYCASLPSFKSLLKDCLLRGDFLDYSI